jgi:hypothetical protein
VERVLACPRRPEPPLRLCAPARGSGHTGRVPRRPCRRPTLRLRRRRGGTDHARTPSAQPTLEQAGFGPRAKEVLAAGSARRPVGGAPAGRAGAHCGGGRRCHGQLEGGGDGPADRRPSRRCPAGSASACGFSPGCGGGGDAQPARPLSARPLPPSCRHVPCTAMQEGPPDHFLCPGFSSELARYLQL